MIKLSLTLQFMATPGERQDPVLSTDTADLLTMCYGRSKLSILVTRTTYQYRSFALSIQLYKTVYSPSLLPQQHQSFWQLLNDDQNCLRQITEGIIFVNPQEICTGCKRSVKFCFHTKRQPN